MERRGGGEERRKRKEVDLICFIDELVIGVSEAYAVARHFRDKPTEEVQREGHGAAATEDFVRKNEKFFVKPEGIYLLFCFVLLYFSLVS